MEERIPLPSDRATTSYASIAEKDLQIDVVKEEQSLMQRAECRICQEEDIKKNLDVPCACSGSLKYSHRSCLQRWVDEKGDLACEICLQPYKSGYISPSRVTPDAIAIDISDWAVSGNPFDSHDLRLLSMAAARRRFLDAEFDEHAARNASGSSFFRSIALILMALLLLKHAVLVNDGEGEDDASAVFVVFLLRAASFVLPCYIMAWVIGILQRLRESQTEEPELTSGANLAFVLPTGGMMSITNQREPRRL